MSRRPIITFSLLLAILLPLVHGLAFAQGRPDPTAALAAQRAALRRLPAMDGTWRGKARMLEPDGKWREHTQTERVGPMLDSTLKVIEGRGYDADGKKVFNAFAVVSWDVGKQAFAMRSWAMGQAGDFSFAPTDSGFVWEIPAGPATIRYTATVRDGKWREVGERIVPGQSPVRFIEMDLTRVGSSDWPAGAAVMPK
jgi:hypothetical protein